MGCSRDRLGRRLLDRLVVHLLAVLGLDLLDLAVGRAGEAHVGRQEEIVLPARAGELTLAAAEIREDVAFPGFHVAVFVAAQADDAAGEIDRMGLIARGLAALLLALSSFRAR